VATSTRQNAFTIIAPLEHEQDRERLAALVESIDPSLGKPPERVPFRELENLHYCSLILVEGRDGSAPGSYLAFEGNIDGKVRPFLEELERLAGDPLREIFRHCEGFDGAGSLTDYWLSHDVGPGTWYVGWRGRSVRQILDEEKLYYRIQDVLDGLSGPSLATARDARSAVQAAIEEDPELAGWAADVPQRPLLVRLVGESLGRLVLLLAAVLAGVVGLGAVAGIPLVTTALVVAAVFGSVLLFLLARARIRRFEANDQQGPDAICAERHEWVTSREDFHLQNHMCIRTPVKRGRLRMRVLRLALFVIGLAHRFYFNRGRLGGIPSIHFARWVILPKRRDLVFFSNYDGSFEGYLGDFVDGASVGLNSVWGNTEGYPRTHGLFRGGAQHERRFKVFARNCQHRTLCWYAAYPHLSVQNIERNARIRAGLFQQMKRDADVESWLRLI
jgi:hypothetical protein